MSSLKALTLTPIDDSVPHKTYSKHGAHKKSSSLSSSSSSSSDEYAEVSPGLPSMLEYKHLFTENSRILKTINRLIAKANPNGTMVKKDKKYMLPLGSMMHDVNRELRMMMYRMMSIVAQAKRQPEEIIYGTEGTNQMGLGNGPYPHDHYHQFNHQNADYNQNYNQFDVHSRSYRPHSPSLHNHQHHSAEEPHNFGNSTMSSHHHNDPTMFTQNHYGPHGVPHIHTHMPYLQNAQTGGNGNHGTYVQQQLHKHASKVHHKHH
uniref:Uncharacterized protein n=1 Tax=Ditylenchus dipsaci TaxID=166011 RepID=A0A915EWD1_9BILA